MTVKEKKEKFINAWGCLGPKWGINKTMAHIHALLLFECEPLCSHQIMEQLEISRGNVNQNLRCLSSWGLITGVSKEGDRKEYFVAEKDMWKVFTQIIKKRKETELVPLQEMLKELCESPTESSEETITEAKEFDKTICEMKLFADKADGMLDHFTGSENSWIIKGFKMMMR